MKPQCALCLAIVMLCVISTSARKKASPMKPGKAQSKPAFTNKKDASPKKTIRKDKSEESEQTTEKEGIDDEENIDDDVDSGDDTEIENGSISQDKTTYDEESGSYTDGSKEFQGNTRIQMKKKGIYYSKEMILKHFTKRDYEGQTEVEEMLRRFNLSEVQAQEKLFDNADKKMMKFYVVEGVNQDTRRKVAQILAHRLKGLYIVNQPRVTLGPVLSDEISKHAYYSLSKYAIANKVTMSLFYKPVVIENYWMEHASFIMAKIWNLATKLPKPGSEVYQHPEDLLIPTKTFAIFNTNPPRLGKKASKTFLFEQRQLLVYKRFTGADVQIIRSPQSAKQIADKIDQILHGMDPRPSHKMHPEFSVDFDDLYGNKTI